MSGDRVEGFKELQRMLVDLGVPSSRWTIQRWSERDEDPFPLLRRNHAGGRRYYIYASRQAVRRWVSRNFEAAAD